VTLFLLFQFLAVYNAGCMTTLQLQHYGIYPAVGREHFARYMRANNRAALLPTILPAMLLLVSSLALILRRPGFIGPYEALAGLGLNLAALLSTFVWQRPIQGRMAERGYDEVNTRLLISTNWIRTVAYWLIAVLGSFILARLMAALVTVKTPVS
jgi:hypothetical protein